MTHRIASGRLALVAALALAATAASASDTLYTVAFETATTTEGMRVVDPIAGTTTPVGAGIAGCCLIPSGVDSIDHDAGVFYFVGKYQADPPGDPSRIFAVDLLTGGVISSPQLTAGYNANFLEFDPATGTLYGIFHETATTTQRLVTIDPVLGTVTPVGAGIAGCCLIPSGVSALDSAGGVAYFVGKFMADPPADPSRIFTLDVATGGLVSSPQLPNGFNQNFLEFDRSPGTLYGVFFDNATATEGLFEIDPATGGQTAVGGGVAGCCLISSGVSAIDPNGDVFYFVGYFQAETFNESRIWGLDLATGAVLDNPILPVGFNYNFLEFDPLDQPTVVAIDVKPGSAVNPINLKGNGVIPVALLTDGGFDALTADVATLRFSGAGGAAEAHGVGHPQDVDGDGDLDLMLHFRTQDSDIHCGDTTATLVGATLGGDAIVGSDVILTIGCP
jgi:uncharacterized protein DUF6923